MLAGVAMGVFESPTDAVKRCIKPVRVVTPNPENTEKYAKIFEKYKRIHDALAPVYGDEE
jgi:xylulokinase